MRARRAFAALPALAVLVACAGTATQLETRPAKGVAVDPRGGDQPSERRATSAGERPGRGAARKGAPDARSSRRPGGLPLEFSVDPMCVGHGDVVRVTVTSTPGATVLVTTIYSDYLPHDSFSSGEITSEGTFVAEWTVPAHAPVGNADVEVVVGKETHRGAEGAQGTARIEITTPGGCR